ncbi:enoyl-CoA hydratase/isomerase [Histoplasma capsulatum H143]|uniref:Enoyl-CoA hydratase/isomerase n=1 Tax=Ajellomyces capsulatus (strain H143) TaxID=544712 RepID=C6HNG3_AJECH|nr:enoyl-CoA hydratase/isomerase [Histoplasma capsulatum H143]
MSIQVPASYSALPTRHVKVDHVPASSATATPVLLLTLNRPDKLNAFTGTMAEELISFFNTTDVDDRVKAIVVTGAGRAFCAGADLEIGFPKSSSGDGSRINPGDDGVEHRDGGGRVTLAINSCRKPTIMALNGPAVGIGITMTLPATIRLATRGSKIGFVFSRRGLVMEAASSFFLPRLIGYSRALHLAATGATYPAEHPLFGALFSEVLPTGAETVARALEIAADIAKNTSIVASTLMREMMYRGPGNAEAAHLLDSKVIYGMFGGRENEEGVKSFLQKRPPVFKGSFGNKEDIPDVYPWWTPVDVKQRARAAKL